jgi:nucleotide-binding universal stress UspA family protein
MDEIVVGVDGSPGGRAALRWAARAARAWGARLVVAHAYRLPLVLTGATADPELFEPELHRASRALLESDLESNAELLAGMDVDSVLLSGQGAGQALIGTAAEASLLVVGARGAGGFLGLRLGSVSEHCARHATCSVVVVPERQVEGAGRIVVGVDGSESAEAALLWAVEEARRSELLVSAVSVYEPYSSHHPFGADYMEVISPGAERRLRAEAEKTLERALSSVAAESDVKIDGLVLAGPPGRVLVEAARDADLLVVGSRGLGGFAGLLLGSVSHQCLHHSSCPVAVVRRQRAEPASPGGWRVGD